MPEYLYECPDLHRFSRFLTLKNHVNQLSCECGAIAEQVLTAPLLVSCAPSICYDSPVDGTIITSWDARQEDLKRNHCRPYDPGMKQDAARFKRETDHAMEQALDETVAETVTKMPTKVRGKLYSDLTEKCLTVDPMRLSA